VLTNHIWSFAGDGNFPRVSTTSVQPFLAYQWPDGADRGFRVNLTFLFPQ
jgi:hypothetical protein